jgi:hypothetical protein
LESLKERDNSEDLGVDRRMILEWTLEKQVGKVWIGFLWLRMGPVAGSCEHGNEPSGSIKGGEFLDLIYKFQDLIPKHPFQMFKLFFDGFSCYVDFFKMHLNIIF